MNKQILFKLLSGLMLCLIVASPASAQQGEPIGLMLSTSGMVTAEDEDGNVRRLQRRSPVYEGDTIITSGGARAQIRFNDRGLVALTPDTSFYIEQHQFNGQEDGTESAIYSLLRGGLQAITGLIGHTNRDNYRVSTPLATIGLRGTHWAATFCTTACDGNPPGLYGGVADGGIDVCNGGGCTAVGANTYFYTPDSNTRPQTLLAPPSVVFADTTEVEEEEEEVASNEDDDDESPQQNNNNNDDSDEGDNNPPAGNDDTTSDTAVFVQRSESTSGNDGTQPNVPTNINDQTDLTVVDDDVTSERNEDVVIPTISTSPAADGSVVVLASARGNQAVDPTEALSLNIMLRPGVTTGDTAALVRVGGSSGSTITALGALEFDRTEFGCDPCIYSTAGVRGTTAELAENFEVILDDGVRISLGRWTGENSALLTNSGTDLNALEDHHYGLALAPASGGDVVPSALQSVSQPDRTSIAVFELLQATTPTDAFGQEGELTSATLEYDLFTQVVTALQLELDFDVGTIVANLLSPVVMGGSTTGVEFAGLTGVCSGSVDGCGEATHLYGTTSFNFVGVKNASTGVGATNVLGSFNLDSLAASSPASGAGTLQFDGQHSFFGAYLLEETGSRSPYLVNAPASSPLSTGFAAVSTNQVDGEILNPALLTAAVPGDSVGLSTVYNLDNVLTSLASGSDSFAIGRAELIDLDTSTTSGIPVTLGRWSGNANLAIGESSGTYSGAHHFIYSPNSAANLVSLTTPALLSYSFSQGTAPTDDTGASGSVSSINMLVDLYIQEITAFNLQATVGSRTYAANLAASYALAGSPAFDLALSGGCSGGDCSGDAMTGAATGQFLAIDSSVSSLEDNSVAVGAYSLSNEDKAMNGTFALAQSEAINPLLVSDQEVSAGTGLGGVATSIGLFRTALLIDSEANGTLGLSNIYGLSDRLTGLTETNSATSFSAAGAELDWEGIETHELADGTLVHFGRWLGDSTFSDSGSTQPSSGVVEYLYAPAGSGAIPTATVSAPLIGTYGLAAGRASTAFGDVGVISDLYIAVDFYLQQLVDFDIVLDFLSDATATPTLIEQISASMTADAVALTGVQTFAGLSGSCTVGTGCAAGDYAGVATLGFLGQGDELAGLVSLGPLEGAGSYQASFVADQNGTIDPLSIASAPVVAAAPVGGFMNFVSTLSGDGVYQPYLVPLGVSSTSSIGLATVYDVDQAVASFGFDSAGTLTSFDFAEGRLEERLVISGSNNLSLGRWSLPASSYDVAGSPVATTDAHHYIYSDALFAIAGVITDIPAVGTYSLTAATSPTNQDGVAGTLNSLDIVLDFYFQTVDRFDIETEIDGLLMNASLSKGPVDMSLATAINLSGTCGGTGCLGSSVAGQGYLSLADSAANSLFGSYGLYVIPQVNVAVSAEAASGSPQTATGVFVAGRDSLDAHPDYVSEPVGTLLDSAALAVSGSIVRGEGLYSPEPVSIVASDDVGAAANQIRVTSVDDASNVFVGFDADPLDCNDCDISVQSGVLVEDSKVSSLILSNNVRDEFDQLSSSADFDVYLGRWDASLAGSFEGQELDLLRSLHYALSEEVTSIDSLMNDSLFDLDAPVLNYSLADATSPTDSLGVVGYLQQANLTIDLLQQLVTRMDLSLVMGDRTYQVGLYDPAVQLEHALLDGMKLSGGCLGGECVTETGVLGGAQITLLGEAAEGALGSYGLMHYDGVMPPLEDPFVTGNGTVINGAFVLARDSVANNTDWYSSGVGGTASAPYQALGFAAFAEDEFGLFPFQRGFISEETFEASQLAEQFGYSDLRGGYLLSGTSYAAAYELAIALWEGLDIDPLLDNFEGDEYYDEFFGLDPEGGALLVESGQVATGLSSQIHFGRWFSPTGFFLDVNGDQLPTGQTAHFIWSSGVADYSLVPQSPEVIRYSYLNGTAPTDHFNNVGEMVSLMMDLDMYQQAITLFDMNLNIEDRNFQAQLAGGPVYLEVQETFDHQNGGALLELAGTCTGGECGEGLEIEGQTSLAFVGDAAAQAAGDLTHVGGVYALETASEHEGPSNRELFEAFMQAYGDRDVSPRMTAGLVTESLLPYVTATGTYVLQGSVLEHDKFIDLFAVPDYLTEATTGLASLTSFETQNGFFEPSGELFSVEYGDRIGLVSIDGAGNQLAFAGTQDVLDGFDYRYELREGVLAEAGGIPNFLAFIGQDATGGDFGINWGRWFADADLVAETLDTTQNPPVGTGSFTSAQLDSIQHFVYTDAVHGILPTYDTPTQARYELVASTSPTDEYGNTGELLAEMKLDLYKQTLETFSLAAFFEDRSYFALFDENYNEGPLGLESLLGENIQLFGSCVGGECDYYDYYDGQMYSTPIAGYVKLAPFGPNGEGFLGNFGLGDAYGGGYGTYVMGYGGGYAASVTGSLILGLAETRDHEFWVVDPVTSAAPAGSVGVISGSVVNNVVSPASPRFQQSIFLIDPSQSGYSLGVSTVNGIDNVISEATIGDNPCGICSIDINDGVLIEGGQPRHEYAYLQQPAEVLWATWAIRPDANGNTEFAFNQSNNPVEPVNAFSSFIYADQLTPAGNLLGLQPLTGYETGYLYYNLSESSPVIDQDGRTGDVSYMQLSIDLMNQQLFSFSANLNTWGYEEEGTWIPGTQYDTYMAAPVALSNRMQFELAGTCYGCGLSSSDIEPLAGFANVALVGQEAEQIIGGLELYATGEFSGIDYGDYSVESLFVLDQSFDWDWAEYLPQRVTAGTAAAFAPVLAQYGEGYEFTTLPFMALDGGTSDLTINTTWVNSYKRDDQVEVVDLFAGLDLPLDEEYFQLSEMGGSVDSFGVLLGGYPQWYSPEYSDVQPNFAPAFEVTWGVWDAQYDYLIRNPDSASFPFEPSNYEAVSLMPWVMSSDLTQNLPLAPLHGFDSIAEYSYNDYSGSRASNMIYTTDSGYVNSYSISVDNISMAYDFAAQGLISFAVELGYGYLSAQGVDGNNDGLVDTWNLDSTGLFQGLALSGCGNCTSTTSLYPVEGEASFAFLGENAEGVMGSIGLASTFYGGDVVSGAFVLQQEFNDHWVDSYVAESAPIGSAVAIATQLATGEAVTSGFITDGVDATALTTEVVSFDHTHPQSLVGFSTGSDLGCSNCSWQLQEGELWSYDSTLSAYIGDNIVGDAPEAYWGRWMQQDELDVGGSGMPLGEYLHFAWSPDPSSYDDEFWANDPTHVAQYSFAGGSAPTDNYGNSGYVNSIYMQVDFGTQLVDLFGVEVSMGQNYYNLGIDGPQALDVLTPSADMNLVGTVWDGTSNLNATGEATMQLIGAEAEGAIGAYNLMSADLDQMVNGSYMLIENSLSLD